ncbi:hypothetical protein ACTGJ9_002845 [Bradyrhizobium sp. RDM12]
MPIVRILLILLAFVWPALAQDGIHELAAARDAAKAFKVYIDGVAKKGGRPDLTRPDVAALLGRVYDLDALGALPPPGGERHELAAGLDRRRQPEPQALHLVRRKAGAAA